jgi:hypothetical protein
VGFDGETEMFGRVCDPVLDGGLFHQLAEGVIDFDGVQLGSVEIQKFLLSEFLWVESGLPGWIRPSGGANVEMRHMKLLAARGRGPQRLKPCSKSNTRSAENWVVPPGLKSLFPLYPALKRWANLGRPSGAGFLDSASTGLPENGSHAHTEAPRHLKRCTTQKLTHSHLRPGL